MTGCFRVEIDLPVSLGDAHRKAQRRPSYKEQILVFTHERWIPRPYHLSRPCCDTLVGNLIPTAVFRQKVSILLSEDETPRAGTGDRLAVDSP